MKSSLEPKIRVLLVVLVTLATVSFHYGLIIKPDSGTGSLFHAIHGRLCYIPIILGAIWFGVRGGLSVALLVIALTLPYGKYRQIENPSLLMNEYTEMVFYIAIGLTSGIMIELQRRERRRSEALAKELARKEHLSSLGEMAAGLAHEIKNPLGSIKGSAEILSDDFPPGSKKYDLLQILSKETGRLNRVVEDFLNFARPRPLNPSSVKIDEILKEVVSQAAIQIKNSGLKINLQLDDSLPPAIMDKEKMHQVFLNVILNAISAMKEEGTLAVSSGKKETGDGEVIIVSIKDTGEGIPEENLEKIFNPFFTTRAKGTGLGLSISHMIVQNHNGRIDVESSPGRGTEFKIILPIDKGS